MSTRLYPGGARAQGKTGPIYILLYSGGLDSSYLLRELLSRGVNLVVFHAFISRAVLAVALRNLVRIIEDVGRAPSLLVVSEHARLLSRAVRVLSRLRARGYTCVVCKMLMLLEAKRYAEDVLRAKNYYIVTGESLGQVASQTLHNMLLIHTTVNAPTLTPLLAADKHEASNLMAGVVEKTPSCPFLPRWVVTREDPILSKMIIDEVQLEKLVSGIVYHEVKLGYDQG